MASSLSETIAGITNYPRWIKITKSYLNFQAGALNSTITIATLPLGSIVHNVLINPTTTFSGGVLSAVSLSIGNTGSNIVYLPASTVFTGALDTSNSPATDLSFGDTYVSATMIGVGIAQTLNNLTQGSVDIYLLVSQLP